ncbi:MAG: Icc protein [Saprospiraceae bacterium]|jgi:Icc protein
MKFIHLTDTHLITPNKLLHGYNPSERLASAFDSINREHADAECCVVTGDLADRGEESAYAYIAEQIKKSPVDFHLILGNHDDREKFLHWFPDTPVDENGFVQYTIKTSAGVFVLLDTIEYGTHDGVYCEKRRKWLTETLEAHKDEPVYLFMHHPPFDLHLPCIDHIGLHEQQAFADLVQPFNNIRHLFFGHAHRPISGQWNGISFSSLRGTNHQVKLDFHSKNIAYADEAPEYAVVFIADDQIVVHTHTYPLA